MEKINKPNEELIKELKLLQQRYDSLKSLYSTHLHRSKILQKVARKSEEKLSESTALIEIAKEKIKIGGWVRNLKKKEVYWTDGITDILEMPIGHKPYLNEVIGFYTPEWRDKITEVLTNCEQEGIPFDEDMEVITAKGKQVWVRVVGEADRDSDGIIVRVNGTFQDISEHKLAENQLQKLSTAVEQSPVSVFMTDIEGNIEYANPKLIETSGYTLEELIGKNPIIFSAENIPQSVYIKLWKAIATGNSWQGELQSKRKTGELYWELASFSPIINKKGKINNYLAIKEDITYRKQKEADLIIANKKLAFQNIEKEKRAVELIIAKEHAEESDRLKSAFLANMSHEIRTPMNGILNFAQLLREPELSEEKKQKYFKIIEKSGIRMLNIIDDIVDISKIESGLMKVHIEETKINKQIKNSYNFFKPEAKAKGLQFSVKNKLHKKEFIIKTDSVKLYAILSNLVKNAIKYTEEGSIIYGYDNKGDDLEFFVKDTGIGIPKDRQEAIFERFIQADIYDKMALQGAGLGLSIAKAYVELLGGKIWVESYEGIGSTFYFTIPCNKEKLAIEKDAAIDTNYNGIGNLKILIAEDDEISLLHFSILVEEFSGETLMARNGLEAVEIYKKNPDIDLILMDMQMPYLNGYEATSQIRQLNKDVVIISQTAYALSYDRQKVIDAGCNDYITKPISGVELKKLIRKYFN